MLKVRILSSHSPVHLHTLILLLLSKLFPFMMKEISGSATALAPRSWPTGFTATLACLEKLTLCEYLAADFALALAGAVSSLALREGRLKSVALKGFILRRLYSCFGLVLLSLDPCTLRCYPVSYTHLTLPTNREV
eukprot:TRINITY_DN4575_c0_g2_i2.p2 TRINITY_DN4575_c0_g2~~TRINITY_DN4575_c0_g2_i2.p2  ORF type:complete len:136 (-),score=17.36 TRINITY_DN4575_c0_g2_i2:39-446(-)